jgi:predicted extracellular nuclease
MIIERFQHDGDCRIRFFAVLTWIVLSLSSASASEVMSIGQLRSGRPVAGAPFDIRPRHEGTTVRVQGVIHQKLLWPGSQADRPNHAFLIQNLPDHADGNDSTSDGLLVYTGKPVLPREGRDADYLPRVGDWVVLEGRLQHRYGQTELSRPRLIQVVKTELDLSSALPFIELKPFPDRAKTLSYLERLEGMRVTLPADALVVSGRKVIGSGIESYAWLIPASAPVALRSQPYYNRVFRDAHPLDDIPNTLFDNDNGFRILLGSHGIKGLTGRADALLPALRVGDRLTQACVGGVIYSYQQFKIMPMQVPDFERGLDPAENIIPEVFERDSTAAGVRLATFNVENLYDHRDDPSDPCDAFDDPGNQTIQPPFNYLPANETLYRNRLAGLAKQVVFDMKEPELILVQEFEDQDILSFGEAGKTFPKPGSDGLPDVLQEWSRVIRSMGGPHYGVAQHRKGADARGISCGFLFRTDRVKLKPLGQKGSWLSKVRQTFPAAQMLGDASKAVPLAIQSVRPKPDQDGSIVYARPPQIARFQFEAEGQYVGMELVVINAHFASRPNERVALRRDQSSLVAEFGKAWVEANPGVGVVIGGDLNVFPRPDDPFSQTQSDQLGALYGSGALSVYDWIVKRKPENAYSYVYDGQSQTLDHLFMVGEVKDRFHSATFLHINCDWPDRVDDSGNSPRGISDHDPLIVSFR